MVLFLLLLNGFFSYGFRVYGVANDSPQLQDLVKSGEFRSAMATKVCSIKDSWFSFLNFYKIYTNNISRAIRSVLPRPHRRPLWFSLVTNDIRRLELEEDKAAKEKTRRGWRLPPEIAPTTHRGEFLPISRCHDVQRWYSSSTGWHSGGSAVGNARRTEWWQRRNRAGPDHNVFVHNRGPSATSVDRSSMKKRGYGS
ncbi:unnamed protein product [Lactuca virosa]|uniref:Uncharacterized protein n=1 Tax=Lactuca virosa TaxID=75947 RepID=A0AAU9LLK1_9ASTR|nr:unnamed protein product [Lactuca virosa]